MGLCDISDAISSLIAGCIFYFLLGNAYCKDGETPTQCTIFTVIGIINFVIGGLILIVNISIYTSQCFYYCL